MFRFRLMGSSSPSIFLAHQVYSKLTKYTLATKQERAVPCLLQQAEQSGEPSVSALLATHPSWREVGHGRSPLSTDSVSSGGLGPHGIPSDSSH